MDDHRSLYLDACEVVVDLVSRSEVGAAWSSRSLLPELSIGALAAHLGRSLLVVDAYLDASVPAHDAAQVDAAGYFVAVLADHDPVTSEFHRGVRRRSESTAEQGQPGLVGDLRGVVERLRHMPLDMDHPIAVLAGIQIPLGDYLATRLVEIAVHCRDLADSLGLDPPALSERCWRIVTDVVVEVAVRRNTPEAVVLALSRGDRFPPAAAF